MESAGIGFNDIANAIAMENRDMSAGNIKIGSMQPTIQVKGQFVQAKDMEILLTSTWFIFMCLLLRSTTYCLLLDVVYNHFGPSGNYTCKFGPYLAKGHPTPWGGAVNLEDAWSSEVRRFFCDNALMWMRDFHENGLR